VFIIAGCAGPGAIPSGKAPRSVLLENGLTTGCYPVGDQQIVLISSYVTGQYNLSAFGWDFFAERYKTCSTTALWDNKWYWMSVPSWDGRNSLDQKTLMLGFSNVTAGTHGFVIVYNEKGQFYLWRRSASGADKLTIGEGDTITTSWHTNDHRVVVTVNNPVDGQGGWDADDIRFKFSD
jgi:hypothetical protein